jgi:transcriptional regulator with XRE-family HTH domain
VRALRNRLGMTQEELAERCGLHRTYIGHLERGEVNPTVSNLLRLSTALEIDAGDLIRRLPG